MSLYLSSGLQEWLVDGGRPERIAEDNVTGMLDPRVGKRKTRTIHPCYWWPWLCEPQRRQMCMYKDILKKKLPSLQQQFCQNVRMQSGDKRVTGCMWMLQWKLTCKLVANNLLSMRSDLEAAKDSAIVVVINHAKNLTSLDENMHHNKHQIWHTL